MAVTQQSLFGARRKVAIRSTSLEARGSLSKENISAVKQAILQALSWHGPLTDEDISRRALTRDRVSASGLRTRRSELVRAGKVKAAGTTKNARGRTVTLWRLA